MNNKHEIINNQEELSPTHAYYSRNKEENPQEFDAPLTKNLKYTDEEIEMLENGIKKISLQEALSLL